MIGSSIMGIQADRLLIGLQRLLVLLEFIEDIALVVIGNCIMGIQADRLLKRYKRLLVSLSLIKLVSLKQTLLSRFLQCTYKNRNISMSFGALFCHRFEDGLFNVWRETWIK